LKQAKTTRYARILYVLDMLGTLLCLWLAEWLRRALPFGQTFEVDGGLNPAIYLVVLLIWTVVLRTLSAYDTHRILRLPDEVQTVLSAVSVATLVLSGTLYLSYRGLSRLLFLYFFLLDMSGVLLLRLAARLVLQARKAPRSSEHRILVVGAGEVGCRMAALLRERSWMGLQMIGFIDDDLDKIGQPVDGHPVLGPLQEAPRWVESQGIDHVIIALPLYAYEKLSRLVALLNEMQVNVSIVPDFFPLAYLRTGIAMLGDMPLISLKEPVLDGSALLVKRVLDLTVAVVALILLWPLMLLIALCIRLDSPGPALFKQERAGLHGKPFRILKFRTMFVGAEKDMGMFVEQTADGRHFLVKGKQDPRITRVGRHLRRWSLDELPQLFNVLKGEMSAVGPRPELPMLVQDYAPWQRKRFSVPPGITGWWQVTQRADAPSSLHTEADLYYIQHYSLWLDVQILLRTVAAVIGGKGAY